MSDQLAVLSEADTRLASIKTPTEAKELAAQAEALRVHAKKVKRGLAAQNHYAAIKILAEQKGGELIAKIERAQKRRNGARGVRFSLKQTQIPVTTAHRWEAMAGVPEAAVRALEAELTGEGRELTSSLVFNMARKTRVPEPPEPIVTPGFPDGPFSTIVIDPPWDIEKAAIDRRDGRYEVVRGPLDYPTMSLDEIRGLPIARLADPRGAHVYLWILHRLLPEALKLFEAWGVRYEMVLTWFKDTAQPFDWKRNTEHVLFGKIGSLALLVKGQSVGFRAPRRWHSHKPDEFFEIVRRVSPGPRLTMFDGPRDGFERWGVQHTRAPWGAGAKGAAP